MLSEDRLALIENLLAGAGHEVNLKVLNGLGHNESATSILEAFFALLAQMQRDGSYREELKTRMREAALENDRLTNSISKLKQSLENSEKHSSTLHSKCLQAEKTSKEINEKLQACRDELMKQTSALQATSLQLKHKLKKKEADLLVLRERVQKSSVDQLASQKVGLRLTNPVKRPAKPTGTGAKRAQTSVCFDHEKLLVDSVPKEAEFYNLMMGTREEREKEIVSENQALRRMLFEVYVAVREQMQLLANEEEDKVVRSKEACIDFLQFFNRDTELARFSLPLNDIVEDVLKSKFQSLFTRIREQVSRIRAVDPANAPSQPITLSTDMQREIDEYKRIIDRQNALLQIASAAEPEFKDEDEDERVSEGLAHSREVLEQRTRQLDEERRKFTEAAIRLGKERCALDRERELLEHERSSFESMQLLSKLPKTPE
ncbi:hypothetical protein HK101_010549 [Irineochytrium annulatum]|nr:hypothetical protein HK101_010549 [Irineochytrium annulatum]